MSRPILHIANKNYSSWSLRPWIGMRAKGICLGESEQVRRYSAAMTALDAWKQWQAAARSEPWTVESFEL